jgi:hypothetical protein
MLSVAGSKARSSHLDSRTPLAKAHLDATRMMLHNAYSVDQLCSPHLIPKWNCFSNVLPPAASSRQGSRLPCSTTYPITDAIRLFGKWSDCGSTRNLSSDVAVPGLI